MFLLSKIIAISMNWVFEFPSKKWNSIEHNFYHSPVRAMKMYRNGGINIYYDLMCLLPHYQINILSYHCIFEKWWFLQNVHASRPGGTEKLRSWNFTESSATYPWPPENWSEPKRIKEFWTKFITTPKNHAGVRDGRFSN